MKGILLRRDGRFKTTPPSSNFWQQYSYDKNSGSYSAALFPNVTNANAWLFTGALNLQAGRYYVLSYYVKTDGNTLFKITLNYTTDYNGQYKTVRNTFPAPSGTFVLVRDTIVCEFSNTYYIGFNNYSTSSYSNASLIDDITFTDLNYPNCGTVTAGTISSSVSSICTGNTFTLTSINATNNIFGIRYAWQKSVDGINWNNINNISYLISPLTISQNSNTYYRLTDTCQASGQTAVSNVVTVTTNNIFNCYCIPSASNCNSFGIDSVSFNTIHNASSCSANGYGNYSTISTTINNGTNVPVYLKFKTNASAKYASVWINFNRNGIFESSEKVFTGTTTGNFLSGVVNIPFNVSAGETGMRVLVDNFSNTTSGPCSTGLGVGEIEDYKIILNVVNPITNKFCYYVKSIATGLNDGTNWTNAFTSLATALSYARTADTIKVAKGTYKPGTTNTSTYLLKDSLIILGGYPDTGNPADADRDFSINQTVMSGEIGTSASTDNVRIILQGNNVKGFVIDGFIIENGYKGYPSTNGPVYFANAAGILKNTVIRNNYNASNGCAVNIQNSTIILLNNFIENNVSNGFSVTAAALNVSAKSDATVVKNVIAKNRALYILNQQYSSVKIVASDTAICPGTLVTFTATAQNAGTTPVYQWVLNGVNVGTNSAVYSNSSYNNNDQVRVKVKNQNCSANDTACSNIIKMIVGTSITPVATITGSDTTICACNPVTLTATATHSNSSSVYQWAVNDVNAGTNSPTFTASSFSNGDIVKVTETINGTCLSMQTVTSNSIVIHVNPALNASVNIVSSANPVCAGSALTFTATAINGGTLPAWQWKVNGNNAGTNSPVFTSLTIANNDIVTVVMTSSAACTLTPTVTSNAITQQVTSYSQPSVTISSTSITCPGTAITFTANAVNGGTNPLFQWKLNGANTGTQSNTYISNTLNESDIVAVTLTSNAGCITSPLVNSTPLVIHYPSAVAPAVSISATGTSICSGSPVSFTASPVNGGTNPIYQWFINNISSGNNNPVFTTNTLNNNDQVKVVMTSSASCTLAPTATSNTITMSVSAVVTPSVTITSGQGAICSGSTASFTATPTNGGTSPAYQWKKNGINVGTGVTYSSNSLANGDIINCVMTSSLTCATTATVTSNNLTVTINQTPATPTIAASGPLSFCSGGSVILTSSAAAGNQWYKDGAIISGAVNTSFIVNARGNFTVVSTISGCASSISAVVSVAVIALPATPIITLTGNQLTTSAGMSSYQWYVNNTIIAGATANTYAPAVPGLYKVEVANAAGCKVTSAEYNFVVTAVGNVVINGVNIICFPNPANDELNIKLSALPLNKTTAQLMDNTGRVVIETVLTSRLQTINVSGIAAGFYLLNITGEKGKGTLKVEVVH